MKKVVTTNTLNPLPFGDMEPHRFEDLVRQLVYELRDWAGIEATGRAGSDEGIDIRGWERSKTATNEAEDGENEPKGEHIIDGNLWVIQCKRESKMGPSDVRRVISDFNSEDTVYGYILVAPTNFSKKSYDTFRSEIRKKGINEYQLWGRAELEDKLLMPKNDHLLFAFFGLSLSTRKRTRTTEARFRVNNKNKILRFFGDGHNSIHGSVLLRDIDDDSYPYEDEYQDFKTLPRWEEVVAYQVVPSGLLVHIHKYYGFVDFEKNVFDYISNIDLLQRTPRFHERPDQTHFELEKKAEDYWHHLPLDNQAIVEINGIVRWQDMLLIDDKGDTLNEYPHIYLSSRKRKTLVPIAWITLDIGGEKWRIDGDMKRAKICPKSLPKVRKLKKPKELPITLDPISLSSLLRTYQHKGRIFDSAGQYKKLKIRDVVKLAEVKDATDDKPVFIEITHRFRETLDNLLSGDENDTLLQIIEGQIGTIKDRSIVIDVVEFKRVYDWQVTNKS